MKKFSIFNFQFSILLALLAFFPFVAIASEVRLEVSKVEVRVGEEFTGTVVLYADEAVNAIEGRVSFPDHLLAVQEIRDGNSSINFWVESPHVESPGVIVYSGITPGGFSGVNNVLFSIVFEAKETGIAHVASEEVMVLRNDGEGTELAVTFRDVEVEIREGGGGSARNEIAEDTEAPEPFTPRVVQDSSVFDGNYFLVFATQDKGSGIKRYEVREGRFGWWKEAGNPHLLAHQGLTKDIYVRAVDNAGNERVALIPVSVHGVWWEYWRLFAILIMIVFVAGALYKKTWLRFTK